MLALMFSSVGHFFAHLLTLLYPTVVLVLEGKWDMSYGDLLSLSLAARRTALLVTDSPDALAGGRFARALRYG